MVSVNTVRVETPLNRFFKCLSQKFSALWIFEADVKACFDKISHKWLLDNVLMDKTILRKWLKSGYIEKQHLYATKEGTPQGGIISPTLMNITLDGLEKLIKSKYQRPKQLKVNFIRYADDFIVTAQSKELLEKEIIPDIRNFLAERGLSLSDEKSKITHVTEGFNFLSQNVRKYKDGKLLIKPAKQAIKEIKYKLRKIVFENIGAKPQFLIKKLNAVLRGWSNYHKHIVAKEIFKEIDYYLWYLLGKWCKRRHPNKPWKWIRSKYFSVSKELCTFSALCKDKTNDKLTIEKLFRLGYVPIIRHTKIRSEVNPFDPDYDKYLEQFRNINKIKSMKTYQKTKILTNFGEVDKQLLNLWKLQPGNPKTGSLRNARAV